MFVIVFLKRVKEERGKDLKRLILSFYLMENPEDNLMELALHSETLVNINKAFNDLSETLGRKSNRLYIVNLQVRMKLFSFLTQVKNGLKYCRHIRFFF